VNFEEILAADEELTNGAFEKYTSGEITLDKMQEIYKRLRDFDSLLAT